MIEIPLTKNKTALIDDEDFEYFNQWNWHASNSYKDKWYAKRTITLYGRYGVSKSIILHREIMGLKEGDGKEVDHINHNGLDNRKGNLRVCNRSQNARNLKVPAKGYSWHIRAKKWIARIRVNGKLHHLGYYLDEVDAEKAYLNARELVRRGHGCYINPLK